MSSLGDYRYRVSGWSSAMGAILGSHSRLTHEGALLAIAVIGLLLALVGVASMAGWTRAFLSLGWIPLVASALCLFVVAWGLMRGRLATGVLRAWSFATCGLQLFAVNHNGLAAMLFMPATIVYLHVLLGVRLSLILCIVTAVACHTLLYAVHPQIPMELQARLLVVNIALLLVMQWLNRFWNRVIVDFSRLSQEMTDVLASADDELRSAIEQREFALANDAISGLPNASGFRERVSARLESAASPALIVSLRLTRFRESVTSLPAPDQQFLLAAVVGVLRDALGDTTLIGRPSVSEFMLLLELDTHAERLWLERLTRLFARLEQPFNTGRFAINVRPRLGMARWAPGESWESAITQSQLAQAEAERLDVAHPLRYDLMMAQAANERLELASDLERALREHEFELYYQPIVAAEGGMVCKAEALVRWHHPERGMISPAVFIPIAEQGETISALTEWILEKACRDVREWRKTRSPDFQVSVNMSPACLTRYSADAHRTADYLSGLQVDPGSLVLEITEGAMLDITPELQAMLTHMRSIGLAIALDDFGVGYSSFGQLDRLELDFLKIDRSFISRIDSDSRKQAVCQAIIAVAQHLGFKVVAEGIETHAQRRVLSELGCDYLQGYLFSKPVPRYRLPHAFDPTPDLAEAE